MNDSGLRVVAMGYVVRGPLGGMAWSDLQYLDSLRAAGHEVFYVEDSDDYPSCYDPRTDETTTDPAYGLAFAARELERIGFGSRWSFYDSHTDRWFGPLSELQHHVFDSCDVVLNLAGVNPLRDWAGEVPVRVMVDQDPGFTQIKNLTRHDYRHFVSSHTAFVTFAENIGKHSCTIPDDGISWQPTRQPVVVQHFSASAPPIDAPFTTVMQWESYPEAIYEGRTFGLKSRSLESLIDLPGSIDHELELAIGAPDDVKARLEATGWRTRDPRPPTKDTDAYVDYIQNSLGEFGIAKHGYVTTASGWFSERTLAYMVLGRPVVVQDTGFTDWLPSTEGVLAYTTADEAATAIENVVSAPDKHGTVARDLAAQYFEGRRVVADLLETVFSADQTKAKKT